MKFTLRDCAVLGGGQEEATRVEKVKSETELHPLDFLSSSAFVEGNDVHTSHLMGRQSEALQGIHISHVFQLYLMSAAKRAGGGGAHMWQMTSSKT